jgi:hypothetical protein
MKITISKFTYKKEQKILTKHTLCYNFFKNKNIPKKTKIDTKEHKNRQNVNICIKNFDINKET